MGGTRERERWKEDERPGIISLERQVDRVTAETVREKIEREREAGKRNIGVRERTRESEREDWKETRSDRSSGGREDAKEEMEGENLMNPSLEAE